MTILIDHQAFSMQVLGGVSRLFAELIVEFRRRGYQVICPILYTENEYYLRHFGKEVKFKFFQKIKFPYKKNILKHLLPIINNIYTIFKLRKQSYDIYLPSYYNTYLIPYNKANQTMTIVHDMIHEIYPELFLFYDRSGPKKIKLIRASDTILTVSQNTMKDLLRLFPEFQSKNQQVIYNNTSINLNDNVASPFFKYKYFLYVGTRKYYKNFSAVIQAMSLNKIIPDDFHLICIGGGGFSSSELKSLKELKIIDRVHQFEGREDQLPNFYRNAVAFIYPSIYEGFGIPIVESMKCGCPIILGQIGPSPEVAGTAGIYCDIKNPEEIATCFMKVYNDKEYRKIHIKAGIEQSKKFTIENTVSNIISAII